MTEFKVGEYTMRNGQPAVVVCEIPNPVLEHDALIGYGLIMHSERNQLIGWSKSGRYHSETCNHEHDLMPRKRKIEQWIFSYYKEYNGIKSEGVCFSYAKEFVEKNKKEYEDYEYICSEIVQAPTLEVEE
jgi:hypothetical protein